MLCCCPPGWDLAQGLLRPRSIEVDDDGRVAFVSTGGFQRIGAQEALRHRFLRPAALHERNLRRSLGSSSSSMESAEESAEEANSSSNGSGSRNRGGSKAKPAAAARNGRGSGSGGAVAGAGAADGKSSTGSGSSKAGSGWWGLGRKKQQPVEEEEEEEEEEQQQALAGASAAQGGLFSTAAGLWRGLQDRLFDLEARMIKTASETAKQTTKVQKLQEKVRLCLGFKC